MATNFEATRVKTKDGWIIVVNSEPWSDRVSIWLGQEVQGKFYNAQIKNQSIELNEYKEGISDKDKQLFTIPRQVWYGLADTIRGVTPEFDSKEVDAELKATKYHLEDMRKLVFEDKTTIALDPNYLCGHGSCLPGKCNYKEEIIKQTIKDILGDALQDGLTQSHGDSDLAKKEQEEIVDKIIATMKGKINK